MEVLKPRAKSTELYKAHERNDPAMVLGFVVDNIKSVQQRFIRRWMNDYSHYMNLIEMSYENISSRDDLFKYEISHSMYQYYCVIALWKRHMFILSERGTDAQEYERFVKTLNCDLAIPSDILLYLNGVGDLRGSDGGDNELHL